MNYEISVLSSADLPMILQWEKSILEGQIEDDIQRQLFSWSAPWREESLNHYLPLGWSFCLRESSSDSAMVGYFLAQPFLFFRGLTQVLWIEHVGFSSTQVARQLVSVAYKFSREKHLQSVAFAQKSEIESLFSGPSVAKELQNSAKGLSGEAEPQSDDFFDSLKDKVWSNDFLGVKTSKFQSSKGE